MLHEHLAGLTILVVDDDYFIAHETCRYLSLAGASVAGPAPSNEAAQLILASTPAVSGALLKVQLRDGVCDPTAQDLARRNIPYINTSDGLVGSGRAQLFTPLVGPQATLLIAAAFRAPKETRQAL